MRSPFFCLGPLTNLARLIRWDPQVVPLIDQIVISGGAVERSGNATPVAERNIHFDPQSAETVRIAHNQTACPPSMSPRK